ncbi:phage tail protein I [Pseudomonas sp. PS02288]|uniref:phage tail protein I n=1 Tax=Pseudomonas sp. PS02288 TaxID=2991443 RepID=UPI00249BE924|nr:phage tail protein I [Pseudomonas sp. PS02288]
MSEDLLPPNASPLIRDIAAGFAGITALPVLGRYVRNPGKCPSGLLPFLAWEMSVDEWNPAWADDVKRRVIAQSTTVHRHKGTLGAVRRALEAIFVDIPFQIIEGAGAGFYDGSKRYNGLHYYGREGNWAKYSVLISRPITQAQAASVRRILAWIAPARCHLLALNFQQALNAYDGAIRYDNSYTHGVA